MPQTIPCDLAIIGAGAGGLSVAAGAAQLGVNVVLIENNKMGGDCLNSGCVPSKSLLAAAKTQWQARHGGKFGIEPGFVKTDFASAMKHVQQVIDTIAEHDSVERFEQLGVNVILGTAKFIDPKTIQVRDQLIKAKRFIIATGSSPFVPPIQGIETVPYFTNETIFQLTEQPGHLIVIGGGPIGMELAQAFAMLGSKVTVLEGLRILPKDEPDCVEIVKQQLLAAGITIYEDVTINNIANENDRVNITYEKDGKALRIAGSHLLVATGRRANVNGLGLEKAHVDFTPKGIVVDIRLRTSNRKIYAIGDVAGQFQFTHVASYHAGIIIKNALLRMPSKVNYRAVPWVTYTNPELAHVGLTMEQAIEQGIDITVTEWPFTENDRAQTEHQINGKIKVLTDKKAIILGVTIVGHQAGELLLPWIMAINEGKTLRSFTDAIAPYPTFSEISKRVAGHFYTPMLFSPKTRRLVKWLMKLG